MDVERGVHLNLIDSSRLLFELDPDAEIEDGPGWLLGAGSASHPMISNAVFRRDGGVDPGELIARAREFFGDAGRGFSVWGRGGQAEDEDLFAAADVAGLQFVYAMPEMTLGSAGGATRLPTGVELRKLATGGQAEDYWKVAAASYVSIGFPPEVFAGYTDHAGLLAENVAAFVAYLGGEPVAIAMTIVSEGVAGIYWVGASSTLAGRGSGKRSPPPRRTPASSWAPTWPPCRPRRWASRSTRRWATRRSSTTGC